MKLLKILKHVTQKLLWKIKIQSALAYKLDHNQSDLLYIQSASLSVQVDGIQKSLKNPINWSANKLNILNFCLVFVMLNVENCLQEKTTTTPKIVVTASSSTAVSPVFDNVSKFSNFMFSLIPIQCSKRSFRAYCWTFYWPQGRVWYAG